MTNENLGPEATAGVGVTDLAGSSRTALTVTRYQVRTVVPNDDRRPYGAMLDDAHGEYVRWSDYEKLRAAAFQACSDMGCYCADDKPLPDNLKCPMCKLEKALHG